MASCFAYYWLQVIIQGYRAVIPLSHLPGGVALFQPRRQNADSGAIDLFGVSNKGIYNDETGRSLRQPIMNSAHWLGLRPSGSYLLKVLQKLEASLKPHREAVSLMEYPSSR